MSEQDLINIENEIKEIQAKQERLRFLLAERTRINNERFAAMTPQEKRVALAKDVIGQLTAGTIVAEQGTYLSLHDDPQEQASSQVPKCDACALGSIFICAVSKPELSLDLEDVGEVREYMHEHLAGIFSREQLDLIETAFEMDNFCELPESAETEADDEAYDDLVERAIAFGDRYEDDKERLIAIMQNVVANQGTFVP